MNLRRSLHKFLDLPLRIKFILSFLVVILFGGLVSLFFGTRLEHRTTMCTCRTRPSSSTP